MRLSPLLPPLAGCALSALLLALSVPVYAEPVTLVRSSGPSANRIDIVVLGDGYTAAELASGKYATDVETMLLGLFAQQPYSEYRNYYNVRRIDVTSVESGADHPENATYRNTALDATYNCAAIQRLICVNTSKVSTVIGNSGIAADQRDLTLVLVNDTTYGGSGGAVAVASLHPQTVELVLHETGHTFALLGDEYGGTPACTGTEPAYPDVTVQTVRGTIKWNLWIDPSTPLPTTTTSASVTGLFSGGNYCDVGYYRPSYDSKMRTLGVPFYAVNQEAHVLRIYNFVSPIDDASPAGNSVTVGTSQLFSVTPTQPYSHALTTTWAVDGVQQGTGAQFTASGLSSGAHTITATTTDSTPWVRNDPTGLLNDTRTWSVTVQGGGPAAFAKAAPLDGTTGLASTAMLSWGTSTGAAAYEYCVDATNDNACAVWSSAGGATTAAVAGLMPGTTYYWQVRASASGSTTYADGASTSFRSFTTQASAPAAFDKVAPAAGATGQAMSLSLSWTPSAGAAGYDYCIDTTNDNTCATWVSAGASTAAALSGLTAGTTYYWQVRATSQAGTVWANGTAAAFASFTTQVSAPAWFAKSAPADEGTGLPTSVVLSWMVSTGATSYDYCIDTTNDNACSTWISTGPATSVALTGLANGTKYYWHVRAVNAAGVMYSAGSTTKFRAFTTQTTVLQPTPLPAAFGKTGPASGAVAQSTSPTLSWGSSSGATAYAYCIDTTNDNACTAWVSTGGSTTAALSGLAAGTTYYWQVRATNASGTTWANGAATAFASFATQVSAPAWFAKSAPGDEATGLPTSVTLSWMISTGATSYDYCIDTTNDNACSTWTSVGPATSVALTGLANGTKYYWHVRAANAAGVMYSGGSATKFRAFVTK